ncbi:MAG: FtsX-like permease family protein, partial [Acidobacteriota bacterium]
GGLIPALGATRAASIGRLGSGFGPSRGRGGGFGRAGATMTILEMGLSVALISGSLMMAKGLAGYADGVLEVPEDRILTARLVAPTPAPGAPADFQSLPASLRRAADGIPGVLAFGITSSLPRTDAPARPVEIAHEAREAAGPAPAAAPIVEVRQGFLEALGARSLVGRLFEERDFADGALPVAVVNERFVDQFLGGRAAVGRRIRGPGSERTGEDREWEIVGVVPELGLSVADPDRAAGFYVPMARVPQAFYVTLRTSDKPATVANALRRAVAEVDPGVRVLKVLPLPLVGREERSFFAGLGSSLVAMGGLALLLSLIGIYSMTTLTLGRRTREIGIRLAIGATGREVLAVVLGAAAKYLTLGGLLGAVLATGFLTVQDRIFVVRLPAEDPWIVPAVVALLAAAGLLATWMPARRALRIEPSEALRED